jgi:hypothetical protein
MMVGEWGEIFMALVISIVLILAAAIGLELLGHFRRGLLARWGKAAP